MQVTKTLEFSAVVWRENSFYVALCPEFDVASQGENIEETLRNKNQAIRDLCLFIILIFCRDRFQNMLSATSSNNLR